MVSYIALLFGGFGLSYALSFFLRGFLFLNGFFNLQKRLLLQSFLFFFSLYDWTNCFSESWTDRRTSRAGKRWKTKLFRLFLAIESVRVIPKHVGTRVIVLYLNWILDSIMSFFFSGNYSLIDEQERLGREWFFWIFFVWNNWFLLRFHGTMMLSNIITTKAEAITLIKAELINNISFFNVLQKGMHFCLFLSRWSKIATEKPIIRYYVSYW